MKLFVLIVFDQKLIKWDAIVGGAIVADAIVADAIGC